MILLKNEDAILPLKPGTLKTIAVIGPAAMAEPWRGTAADYYAGGGSGHVPVDPKTVKTPFVAIKERAAYSGIEATLANKFSGTELGKADICVAVVGAPTTEGV